MRKSKKQFLYASVGAVLATLVQYSLIPAKYSHATEFATFHLVDKATGEEVRPLSNNDTISIAGNLAIEARVKDSSVDKVRFEPNCGVSSVTDESKPFRIDVNSFELKNNSTCGITLHGWTNPWSWKGQGNLSVNISETVPVSTVPASTEAAKTFHVSNGKIYDANKKEFIPIGVNSVHAWLNETNARSALTNEIKKSGANAVRLVTSGEAWHWTSQSTSPQKKRELVKMTVEAGLVPIIELHDGTCETAYDKEPVDGHMGLKQIVDHWLQPDNVKLMKDYERYLILNIANEWGGDPIEWRNAYKRAITRLRNAGIKNMLLIDAGGCGQNPDGILTWGKELLNHDPLRNVAFSVHMYGLWTTADKPHDPSWQFKVEDYLKRFKESGLAIVLGEFGWEGSSTVAYNPKILIQKANEYGIGWLFWAWYDTSDKPFFNLTKNTSYSLNSKTDFTDAGKFLVNDPQNGMKVKAKKASIFGQ